MSVKASSNSQLLDIAATVLLRSSEDGSESAGGFSAAGAYRIQRAAAYWNSDTAEPFEELLIVEGNVTTLTPGPSSAVFELRIYAGSSEGNTPTLVASLPLTTVGPFSLSIDLAALDTSHLWLRSGSYASAAGGSINFSLQARPDGARVRKSKATAKDTAQISPKGAIKARR